MKGTKKSALWHKENGGPSGSKLLKAVAYSRLGVNNPSGVVGLAIEQTVRERNLAKLRAS